MKQAKSAKSSSKAAASSKSKSKTSASKAKKPSSASHLKKVPAPAKKAQAAAAPSKKAAVEAPASKKKILTNPFESFMALWKPKSETFEAGVDRLIQEFPAPDKNVDAYRRSIVEKIHSQMRKAPLSSGIEEQLLERFPKDRIHKFGSIWSMKPKSCIRLNVLRADLRGFAESMTAQDLKTKRGHISPWAFEVGKPEDLHSHPALQKGLFDAHDEASQLVSLMVNARPGQRILDMNAGEGNNALAVSAMMRNKGSLFVYESDAKKVKAFKEKAEREGVDNFRVLTDSQISEVKSLDSVLIDAPNSHLGDIGNHPDLKWRFHKEELPRIQKLQAAFIREGARKLKLGGYLIYATRTLNKSENEAQIEHFLKTSHNSYRCVPVLSYFKDLVLPYVRNFFGFDYDEKLLSSFGENDPYMLLLPDIHGTAGTFIGIIQRVRIST